MDAYIELFNAYGKYILCGVGLAVILIVLKVVLNRPTKAEKEHRERFERIKEQHAGRYRDLRPLK